MNSTRRFLLPSKTRKELATIGCTAAAVMSALAMPSSSCRKDDNFNNDCNYHNSNIRWDRNDDTRISTFSIPKMSPSSTMTTYCESSELMSNENNLNVKASSLKRSDANSSKPYQKLSKLQTLLHKLPLLPLSSPRTPRILSPTDPAFSYPSLKRGLKRRAKDEEKMRKLQTEAVEARKSGDGERIKGVFDSICEVAFGKGVTPQMREDFVVKYGCTGWTDEVLDSIVALAQNRGLIEIGAGNGQWARAIQDRYNATAIRTQKTNRFEFILPYDDQSSLPLSPKIYHSHTQAAHDHFHPHVRHCTSSGATNTNNSSISITNIDVVRNIQNRNRILLLVYPPPGPMALETVKAFVDVYPEGNDTVIYVGEGFGGANANEELFREFLNCNSKNNEDGYEWILFKEMDVLPCLGGKGYEKMFVLKRVRRHLCS